MNIEELLGVVKSAGVAISNEGDFGGLIGDSIVFQRNILFSCDGEHYRIEWYCNLCTLYSGSLIVHFDSVCVSNSFPVRSDIQLHFFNGGERVAILAVKYEKN